MAKEDLAQLEKLAGGLLILNEARGWYLDTVGLTADMLAVLAKSASSPDRINQEIALRTSLARALMSTKGYTPEVEEAFGKSLELFERGGTHSHQQFSALRALANLYNLRGDPKGKQLGRELLAFAEQVNNPEMLVEGHLLVGADKMFVDDLKGGLDHLDRAIAIGATLPPHAFSSPAGGKDPRVVCFTTSAITLWLLGYPERAAERMNEGLTLAGDLSHPFTDAFARFHSCVLHLWLRDFDTVLERAAGAARHCRGARLPDLEGGGNHRPRRRPGRRRPSRRRASPTSPPGWISIRGSGHRPCSGPCCFRFRPLPYSARDDLPKGFPEIDPAIEMMSADAGTSLLSEFYILKGDLLLALAAQQGRDEPGSRALVSPGARPRARPRCRDISVAGSDKDLSDQYEHRPARFRNPHAGPRRRPVRRWPAELRPARGQRTAGRAPARCRMTRASSIFVISHSQRRTLQPMSRIGNECEPAARLGLTVGRASSYGCNYLNQVSGNPFQR